MYTVFSQGAPNLQPSSAPVAGAVGPRGRQRALLHHPGHHRALTRRDRRRHLGWVGFPILGRHLVSLTSDLAQLAEHHLSYLVLHYFPFSRT